jgi:hypothetical protein
MMERVIKKIKGAAGLFRAEEQLYLSPVLDKQVGSIYSPNTAAVF